ncbi:MAG: gliding motility-associated C-terminal domain-containing protein, partial [Bacteroidia bacterium]|nr:gliding motility-associated C-terminal domain-containing protein [Bacteroidia bacterium]
NRFRFQDSTSSFVTSAASYLWSFGSGASTSSSTSKGPHSIVYSSSGYKNISLIVKDANGCSDTATSIKAVYPQPVAKITASANNLCLRGNIFRINSDSSIGNNSIKTSVWRISSANNIGNSTQGDSINLTFNSIGQKTVTLITENNFGCFDTTVKTFIVKDHPQAKINQNTDSLCFRNHSFSFNSDSSKAITNLISHDWYIEKAVNNKNRSGIQITNIKFDSVGNHKIRLIVTDRNGCSDTTNSAIVTLPHPIAIIKSSDTVGCASLTTLNFSSGSKIIPSSTLKNIWFGDFTNPKNQDSISIKYPQVGKYRINLATYSPFGCNDSVSRIIEVDTVPEIKISNLTSFQQCYSKNEFVFVDLSKNNQTYSLQPSRKWEYEGKKITNSKDTFIVRFSDSGTYFLKLTRFSKLGCISTDSIKLTVFPNPETEIITIRDLVCHDSKTAQIAATSSGGTQPYKYKWNNKSSFGSVLLDSCTAGYYSVISVDKNKCEDTADIYIKAPDSMFLNVVFKDPTCLGSDNGTAQVFINGGNGSPYKYVWSANRPRYSDTLLGLTSGKYSVKVTDKKGCSSATEFTLVAPSKLSLTLNQTKPISCYGYSDGEFTGNPNGGTSPYQYSVNYGPPNNSNKFSNLKKGKYIITYIDNQGCTGSDSFSINQPEPITTNLSFDSIVCFGDSSGKIYSTVKGGNESFNYYWYNHSNSLLSIKPTLENINSGNYKLIVEDILKCRDTTNIFIPEGEKYYNQPVYSPNHCWGSSFIIQTKDPTLAKWQIPGAVITTDKLIIDNFSVGDTGRYIVSVINNKGCLSSDTFYLRPFNYTYAINDTAICEQQPLSIFLKNIKSTEWKLNGINFKPNIFNELWIPRADKNDSGYYAVNFITKDNCKDSIDFNLTIHEKLDVKFDTTSAPFQICENQNKIISINTNSSFDGFWKYPDGSMVPVNSNSFIRFSDVKKSDEGIYTLFSVDNNGCTDTSSFFLNVGKISPAELYKNSDINCFFPKGNPFFISDITLGARTSKFYLNDSIIAENNISVPLQFDRSGYNRIKLVIKTDDGCIDSTEEILYVNENPKLFIPNSFTPNNDLLNGIFKPVINSSVKKYKMSIFNRWGEQIFEEEFLNNSNNPKHGWDGTYQGKPCQEGWYVCLIQFNDTCSQNENVFTSYQEEVVILIR